MSPFSVRKFCPIILLILTSGPSCLKVVCNPSDVTCSLASLLALRIANTPCQNGSGTLSSFYTFVGVSGGSTFQLAKACATVDGGYAFIGYSASSIPTLQGKTPIIPYNTLNDGLMIKLDANGLVDWYTFIGGTGQDQINDITQTSDGGYALGFIANVTIASMQGKTPLRNSSGGGGDFGLAKLSSTGNVEWFTYLGGTGSDTVYGLAQAADGGYFLVGTTATTGFTTLQGKTALNAFIGTQNPLMIKTDSVGTTEWFTFLGSAGSVDNGLCMTATSDGGFIMAGLADQDIPSTQGKSPLNAFAGPAATNDALVAKYTGAGTLEWYSFFGSTSADSVIGITQTNDGGYGLAINSAANIASIQGVTPPKSFAGGTFDPVIMKLNSQGTLQWFTFAGSALNDTVQGIAKTTDGGLIFTGSAQGTVTMPGKTPLIGFIGGNDFLTMKFTSAGAVDFYTFAGSVAGADTAMSVTTTADGGYLLAGQTDTALPNFSGQTPINPFVTASNDGFIMKIKSDGSL